MDFLGFRARSALLARAKILKQPLTTYKTFVSDRFFLIFLIGSIQKMGLTPPSKPFENAIFSKRYIRKKKIKHTENHQKKCGKFRFFDFDARKKSVRSEILKID